MRGWVSEEILPHLPSRFFEDPVSSVRTLGGEVLKESRLRWAGIFDLTKERRIFLKRDKTKGAMESLKYLLLPSKGRREWVIAYQSYKKNLAVPKPVGWMEKVRRGLTEESYYLSEAVSSGYSSLDSFPQVREGWMIAELSKLVLKVHESGLFHKDLHAGNFLWDGTSFFITDLHRAQIMRSLSMDKRLWNLSQLFHSLRPFWGETQRNEFVELYFSGEPSFAKSKEPFLHKIDQGMDRLQKRQWRSRTKRCLKESTKFSVGKEAGVHHYHRRDIPLDRVKEVVRRHERLTQERSSPLLKSSPAVVVSITPGEGETVCVKQFLYPRFWGRFKELWRRSKGLRAWVAGNGLPVRGIPSLRVLALAERRGWLGTKESFLLMEALKDGVELDRYVLRGFEDVRLKRRFILAFAGWVSGLHSKGVYHKDMKTCNVWVSGNRESWQFRLLDLEDVTFDHRVTEREIFRNLLQLNTSTPRLITRTDRLRFFRAYVGGYSMAIHERTFLRRLLEQSRRRGLVYVSPQGVRVEQI